MKQHPMTKAFVAALVKNGGKKFKYKFTMHTLDQSIIFGYRAFIFRIHSVGCVASYEQHLIPKGVDSREDIVMIQSPHFGEWLACDEAAKAEYEEFVAIVARTIGKRTD